MRRRPHRSTTAALFTLCLVALVMLAACAPTAAPTPTPTKAPPPPATPTAAAPKVEATKPAEKPAEKPAATPTTAVSKPTGKAVKVCYLTPLSGPVAVFGLPQSIAVKMAQEDINNSGGINGSPLEVLMKDSPFDPKQAVTLVRECAEKDQALAIFGPYSSGEYDVAAPLAKDLSLPVISATSSKVGGTLPGRPWAFRISNTDDVMQDAGVRYFNRANPQVKKMVIVGDIAAAVIEPIIKTHFPASFKKYGLELLGTVEFTTGMTDMSAVVTKIKSMNPEGIAVIGLPAEWMLVAKELARQGVKLPVLTTNHAAGGNTVFVVKDEVEGWILSHHFQEDLPGPEREAYVKRFKALGEADPRMPKPVYATVEAYMYDALMYSAKVMREGKVTGDTPAQQARVILRDGFNAMKGYKGIVRTYEMNQDGDAVGQPFPVVARKGRWELLWKDYQ